MKKTVFIFFCFIFLGGSLPAQENDSLGIDSTNSTEIEGVVIRKIKKYKNKKENPAYAIMQEVWKRKKSNGLNNFKDYQFDEYEKIEFNLTNLDSTFMKMKIFNKLDFVFKYTDSTYNYETPSLPIFLNEAVYKNYGKNQPKKERRDLIANKSSGFKDNPLVSGSSKSLFKEINIYDDVLNFLNIGFPSPASSNGFSVYDYNLVDSLTINGTECYQIKYAPKKDDNFAFKGDLFISKNNYSIVRATLGTTKKLNVNFINSLYTEIDYEAPNDETFILKKTYTELYFSFLTRNADDKGMLTKKTVIYKDHVFDQGLSDKIFEEKYDPYLSGAYEKDDEYWESSRPEGLSKTEAGIYQMLDELERVPKFNNMVKLFETIQTGYFNIGKVFDIGNLYSTYGHNSVEGDRLRFGGRTYFSRNDMWRIQGYGAYGFKDKKFKYAAEARYMFNKFNRFTVGAATRKDIMQLGIQSDGIMSRSFASSSIGGRGDNDLLSSVNQGNFFVSIEPMKNFEIRLDSYIQEIKSANKEKFNLDFYKDGKILSVLHDSHVSLSLSTKPKAQYHQYGLDRNEVSNLSPVLSLKYTKGFDGIFNSDFNYDKLQFFYTQPILIQNFGKSIITFEFGKNFNTVPLALQNVIPGNQSYTLADNTFSQLDYYEFVTDTYGMFFGEHHLYGKLFSQIPLIKALKLREVIFFKAAYGTLRDSSKNINLNRIATYAPDKNIYFEYGFGIENIGFGNFRFIRVDFNWRGNYLDRPNAEKFGVKAGFDFKF